MEPNQVFSKEKKALLDCVASLKLPVVIMGATGSGCSTVGAYLKQNHNKLLLDIGSALTDFDSLPATGEDFEGEVLKDLVVVSPPHNTELKIYTSSLKECVKIKCFVGNDGGRYIHVILVKDDSSALLDGVSPNNPVVFIRGKGSSTAVQKYIFENKVDTFELASKESFDLLYDLIRGRTSTLKLYGKKHYKEASLPEIHFKLDIDKLDSMLTNYDIFSALYVIRALGIMVTLYSEEGKGPFDKALQVSNKVLRV